MKNGLPDFDRILFTDLRPAHLEGKPQDWFTHLISELSGEPLKFKRAWVADYIPPINPMTKYYKKLIDHQHNSYYNHICSEMLQASTEHEKSFILTVALSKVIGVKLKEIAHEINITKADPEVLKGDVNWKQEQGREWETAFILHYLKLTLTVLYLNIQDRFAKFMDEDRLTADTLELTFFRGIPSSPGSIRQSDDKKQPLEPAINTVDIEAHAGTHQSNRAKRGNDEFNPIINQMRFDEIVNHLKEYHILDSAGHFIFSKTGSHKSLLASACMVMMECGFFRPSDPVTKRKLKETDICYFLDNIFATKIYETFRKLEPEDLEQAKIKLPFLDRVR